MNNNVKSTPHPHLAKTSGESPDVWRPLPFRRGEGVRVRGVLLFLVLFGCAPRATVLPPRPATSIHRLAVQPFEGTGGTEVTREVIHALKAAGWTLTEQVQNSDAVLIGIVHDYTPNRKLVVFLGDTNVLTGNQTATVSNPVLSMNGSEVLPQGPTTSVSSPHLVAEQAIVEVSARLMTTANRTVVWGDDFSYESLELPAARQAVVSALVQSVGHAR